MKGSIWVLVDEHGNWSAVGTSFGAEDPALLYDDLHYKRGEKPAAERMVRVEFDVPDAASLTLPGTVVDAEEHQP